MIDIFTFQSFNSNPQEQGEGGPTDIGEVSL